MHQLSVAEGVEEAEEVEGGEDEEGVKEARRPKKDKNQVMLRDRTANCSAYLFLNVLVRHYINNLNYIYE